MFKLKAQWEGYLEMPQIGQESAITHKPVTKCPENVAEAGHKCVFLNGRRIANKTNLIKHYGRRYNWYNRIMGQQRHSRC